MPPNTHFSSNEAIPLKATFDPISLRDKSVIITGGASGIGEVCLRALVQHGAFVTCGDVADDRGKSLAAELGPEKVVFVHCDVTKWKDQLHLFKTALTTSPSHTIDLVLANAGIFHQEDHVFLQTAVSSLNGDPLEPDLSVLQTNFIGVVYTAKLALYYLPLRPPPPSEDGNERDRCLIITGSMAGYIDFPSSPQYHASKWAVRGLMRSLRHMTGPAVEKEEGVGVGVRVNLIAPWFVNTRLMPQDFQTKIHASGIEFVEIADAATAVLHLASDTSINGRSLAIVPKRICSRGYIDLEIDDVKEGEFWGLLGNNAPAAATSTTAGQ